MTIKVQDVSKSFGKVKALDRVAVQFGGQKIYGLLGNNGAGKSTLLNIITSRYLADSGTVTLDGVPAFDNDQALGQMYLLSEADYYPDDMRVNEGIRWAGAFYPKFDTQVAGRLAQSFELPAKKKISELSTGYKTIFKIVIALSTNAAYLLLDEPVLGLDARHRDMFYKSLLERYSENPATVVISTHLIAEVANLIEHCVIISNGRIIKDAPCEDLLRSGYSVSGPAALLDQYLDGKEVISCSALGGLKTAFVGGAAPAHSHDSGGLPVGLEVGKMNLQDYFIQLTKGEKQ